MVGVGAESPLLLEPLYFLELGGKTHPQGVPGLSRNEASFALDTDKSVIGLNLLKEKIDPSWSFARVQLP